MAGEGWLSEAAQEAWLAERAVLLGGLAAGPALRVWNGTSGGSAAARNWYAKAAFAGLRHGAAQRGLRCAEAAGAPEACARWEAELLHAAVARGTELRALVVCRHAGSDMPGEEPAVGAAASQVPAGCQRVDEALAGGPTSYDGVRLLVEIAPAARGRKRVSRRALQAAQQVKARARERARQAAGRRQVQLLQRQRQAPETAEAVRAWHAADKRRRERNDAVAAAEEAAGGARPQKAQRTSLWGADAVARVRDLAALEWREREATALATRAGRRGSLTAMRARRESVHIRYGGPRGLPKVQRAAAGSGRGAALLRAASGIQ